MQPTLPETENIHPLAEDLDLRRVSEVVELLHDEDVLAVKAVGQVLPAIAQAAEWVAHALQSNGRLIYLGAGTSGRLAVLDASECPPTFGTRPDQVIALLAGGPAAMTVAIERAEDDSTAGEAALRSVHATAIDVVCGITASGRTPFVRGGLQLAQSLGARTILVCCTPETIEASAADLVIAPATGAELVAGSTRLKAGTATKLILNAISTAAMVSLGKVYRGRMIDLRLSNAKLQARGERMVAELTGLDLSDASRLLSEAGNEPRVALAMYFTGLGRETALQRLQTSSLRALETHLPPPPKP